MGLQQVIDFPTREDNILDIITTNRPTLVEQCHPLPRLGDCDVIFMEISAQATRQKPIRREIFLWKKADIDIIRLDVQKWADQFGADHSTSTPAEILCNELQ